MRRENRDMLGEMLENVRKKAPLIHNINNYVTANDCANILLACGASPIMADAPEEAREITALTRGLSINLGTINRDKVEAMLLAGEEANRLGNPVVLDPVGVGASAMRTDAARRLLERVFFGAIRGNVSEIRTLAENCGNPQGVDADERELVTMKTLQETSALAMRFARRSGAVIVITGETDIVTDGERLYHVSNGHALMRKVTGSGCQLTVLMAAFQAANKETPLEAVLAAVTMMGLAGEIAAERMSEADGNVSFGRYVIDAIFRMTPERLEAGANYQEAEIEL